MTTQQIFDHFNIPLGLQQHMYTVAGIGKYITDNWLGEKINQQAIVTALLIHDLGNLVKFDLSPGAKVYDPTLATDQWRKNQQMMIEQYSSDAHQATLIMAKEIVTDPLVLKLVASMDATNLAKTFNQSWEEKICEYADLRVTPFGITSLENRLNDIHQRYKQHSQAWSDEQLLTQNKSFGQKIEQQLQTNTKVDIITIPAEKIATYLVELPDYQI